MTTMDYHPETIELHVFRPQEDGEEERAPFCRKDDGTTSSPVLTARFFRTGFILKQADDENHADGNSNR